MGGVCVHIIVCDLEKEGYVLKSTFCLRFTFDLNELNISAI